MKTKTMGIEMATTVATQSTQERDAQSLKETRTANALTRYDNDESEG